MLPDSTSRALRFDVSTALPAARVTLGRVESPQDAMPRIIMIGQIFSHDTREFDSHTRARAHIRNDSGDRRQAARVDWRNIDIVLGVSSKPRPDAGRDADDDKDIDCQHVDILVLR